MLHAVIKGERAGMVKRYHVSFPSSSCGFDSRYPLQFSAEFTAPYAQSPRGGDVAIIAGSL